MELITPEKGMGTIHLIHENAWHSILESGRRPGGGGKSLSPSLTDRDKKLQSTSDDFPRQ